MGWKPLGIGVVCALAMMGQTCAKHVNLVHYYGTWTDSARFDLRDAIDVDLSCPSATAVVFVDVTFQGVPEWLNGDETVAANAVQAFTIAGLPAPAALVAWRECLSTGACSDDYFFSAQVALDATTQIVITPPDAPSPLLHNIYVGHQGCWNTFKWVPLLPRICPDPGPGVGTDGCRQYQTSVMIPRTSGDQLDACAWSPTACSYEAPVSECDPDGCALVCPDGAPYDMLSGIQQPEALCCPCPPG